jgi:F-type H+-transporting ATPase subunit delta
MLGASRAAAAAGQQALDAALGKALDPAAVAEDLFGVARAVDSSASLRRALTDPTRAAADKSALITGLVAAKVGAPALGILQALVGQRWSSERDLADAMENLAVQSLVASAQKRGMADQVEDELFRFERIVTGNPALREVLTDRHADADAKKALVQGLLVSKAQPETVRLASQAVTATRGRRFDRVVENYLAIITTRRSQMAATVIAAVDLDQTQRDRLAAALGRMYGRQVHLNVVLDPSVVGGVSVQVGDEVLDGTILRKLEGARRHFGA